MITLAKVKSSAIENGKRIVKVLQFGTKTAKEVGPFGFDSSAPENWTAIFAETTNKDESVIVGYINKNQLSGIGESRMYSLGDDGSLKAYILCDGKGQISLNGNQFSSVRFENLQTSLNAQNSLINAELTKIAIAINSIAPGAYVPAPVSININTAKSGSVKLK
jgi:hypothetical protein